MWNLSTGLRFSSYPACRTVDLVARRKWSVQWLNLCVLLTAGLRRWLNRWKKATWDSIMPNFSDRYCRSNDLLIPRRGEIDFDCSGRSVRRRFVQGGDTSMHGIPLFSSRLKHPRAVAFSFMLFSWIDDDLSFVLAASQFRGSYKVSALSRICWFGLGVSFCHWFFPSAFAFNLIVFPTTDVEISLLDIMFRQGRGCLVILLSNSDYSPLHLWHETLPKN